MDDAQGIASTCWKSLDWGAFGVVETALSFDGACAAGAVSSAVWLAG